MEPAPLRAPCLLSPAVLALTLTVAPLWPQETYLQYRDTQGSGLSPAALVITHYVVPLGPPG